MSESASSFPPLTFGAYPPSSPTVVPYPFSVIIFFAAWNISAIMRTASRNEGAPTGIIMNSLNVGGLPRGACAAVYDVALRKRERHGSVYLRERADVFIARASANARCRLRGGKRDRKYRIGAEPRLVWRTVELNEFCIDRRLLVDAHADDRSGNFSPHMFDGLQDSFAAVPFFVAVPQFMRFVSAGRSARRDDGAADDAASGNDVGLYRRVSP